MPQERRSWLYLLIGASMIFTTIVILRGFRNFDENFLPTLVPAPAPLRYSQDNHSAQEQDNSPTYETNALLKNKSIYKNVTTSKSRILNTPINLNKNSFSTSTEEGMGLPLSTTTTRNLIKGMKASPAAHRAVRREKLDISRDMVGFTFQDGGELKDYTLQTGGQPIKALVVTTWRSGSTFLGDIMNAHPATYYHYEPLLHFDIRQARTGHLAREGLRVLNNLMACNYTKLESYLDFGKSHNWLFNHNNRLWQHCDQGKAAFCWNPQFLNRFCSLFPFQSIKTVRLRLALTKKFMEDKNNKVKVLLLIRDPRGTMESRKHRDWCPGNPDCDDPSKLCSDLVADYYAYQQLSQQFPDRYKVFRYEDFSMQPYENSADVFKFFGFTMHNNVKQFLDTHTKSNIGGVSSTFRDTKTAPFKWREKLTREEVFDIQSECAVAMELWGYRPLERDQDLLELDPVVNLSKFTV